jgi:hypothetical protein
MSQFLRMRAQPLFDRRRRQQQQQAPDWLERQAQAKAARAKDLGLATATPSRVETDSSEEGTLA